MTVRSLCGAVMLAMIWLTAGSVDAAQKRVLTLADANRVMNAAIEYAQAKGAPGAAIAIVDDGGQLVQLARLDNTFAAGANISIGKARTAALFKKPTKAFEDIVNNGRTTMVALPDFTPLQGGVPIVADGQVIGAIGVSGASSAQQDEEVAMAGAAAMAADIPDKVSYFDAHTVDAAFKKGGSLLQTAAYKVNPSRRDGAGEAEVHTREADVFYVLSGSAEFVTGGELVNARMTGDEIRGTAIIGGETRRLGTGDIIVIPAGVPHWFKRVDAPLTYYVVKSVRPAGGL